MRSYETIIIYNPTLPEEKIKAEVAKMEKLVAEHGGKELKVNSWGRKELAYLMDKQRFGTYVCFNYSSEEGGIVKELASQLRITESVLRFQTHRLNDRSRKFKGRTSSGKGESHSEAA